jgi:hypothetical protein
MSATHQVLLAGGGLGYQIPYSLRFRASNSAYLSRTFGSPTSSSIWTFSAWVKRGLLASTRYLLGASTTTNFGFNSSDQLTLTLNGVTACTSTAVFRDPTAWMHVVYQQNGSAQTIYVNGSSVATGTTAAAVFNTAIAHQIGAANTTNFSDGYIAEVNFIDGQALTPSSFGYTSYSVWVPKKYAGTYGANGFYLKFNDATTTTTIGNDSSGNANNWTTSGISVTSGVTFDQMTDTPTLNYAVFDAISPVGSASSIGTLSAANMTFDHSAANYAQRFGSFAVNSGKWYFEYTITTFSSGRSCAFGIGKTESYPSGAGAAGSWTGCVAYGDFGDAYLRPITEAAGVSNTSGVASMTFAVSDVIMIAFDVGAGKFWMGKNGTWFDSGNPAGGTNEKQTLTANINWRPWCVQYGSSAAQSVVNYGQRAFSYTPPSGFKALNTQNVTSTAVTVSGSFTGNAAADGPFIWTNGNPATLTINGNAVTFGTHADKTAGGFKLRSSSASYNASGTNNWTATAGNRFVQSKRPNNGQVNP